MLKHLGRALQKQTAKTNQFGCGGRRAGAVVDLKHANQPMLSEVVGERAKAKQLKPENCRPGNKQSGSFSLSPPFLSILGRSSPAELASGARQFTLTMLPLFQRGCCFRKETDWAISGRASQSSRLVITPNQPSRQDSLGPSWDKWKVYFLCKKSWGRELSDWNVKVAAEGRSLAVRSPWIKSRWPTVGGFQQ